MTDKVNLYNPIPPVRPDTAKQGTSKKPDEKDSFQNLLQKEIKSKDLKFSSHCMKRLEQSNIEISQGQLEKLAGAVDKADLKGAKDSLVLMDNLAFVVNVKNKTVITAVEGDRMKENVFTKIDSAVIV